MYREIDAYTDMRHGMVLLAFWHPRRPPEQPAGSCACDVLVLGRRKCNSLV